MSVYIPSLGDSNGLAGSNSAGGSRTNRGSTDTLPPVAAVMISVRIVVAVLSNAGDFG
jgi:hypothetical protein